MRQKIAEFACEAMALRYTGYRQLTRRLKGMPPGPEGSMMKLCGTELNLRIQLFAMELLGPYSQIELQRAVRDRQGQVVVPDAGGARRHDCGGQQSDTT